MINRVKSKDKEINSLSSRLKNFFNPTSKNDIPENLPTHLIPLFEILKSNKEEDVLFAQYAKNVVKVNSSQELLQRMLMER